MRNERERYGCISMLEGETILSQRVPRPRKHGSAYSGGTSKRDTEKTLHAGFMHADERSVEYMYA